MKVSPGRPRTISTIVDLPTRPTARQRLIEQAKDDAQANFALAQTIASAGFDAALEYVKADPDWSRGLSGQELEDFHELTATTVLARARSIVASGYAYFFEADLADRTSGYLYIAALLGDYMPGGDPETRPTGYMKLFRITADEAAP